MDISTTYRVAGLAAAQSSLVVRSHCAQCKAVSRSAEAWKRWLNALRHAEAAAKQERRHRLDAGA